MRTTSRIEPLRPPYEPAIAQQLSRWTPPNATGEPPEIFRILFKYETLWDRMRPLIGYLLGHSQLSLREREFLILRISGLCGAEYEWGMHAAGLARIARLSEEEIAETLSPGGSNAVLGVDDRLLLRIADELYENDCVSDQAWALAGEKWSESQLLEMVVLVGTYRMISGLVRSLDLGHEEWAMKFPK